MKLKRIAAMLTVAVMAVSLAACGGNTGTNTESSQNPKENAEAQAVHLNLAESWGFEYFYTILTPEVSSSGYDITYYLTSFYDTLFEYNSEGEVVGVLAEDWSMSEDGKTYTFQIKQGVKFSDGSDLTAEDVAKSILAVPVNLGQYNGSYGRLSTIIEDAVATDEYTVELHLTQPYYNTLRELCLANPFGIVSSEQFNEDLTAKQESFRSATYGTGPYMYAGDNDGQTWNFVRNPNYWGEAPEVDSFSIKYIPDNDAKILAMLKRMFALSNQGLRDLNKGIAATTLSNLCLIAPVSLLVMVIWELLNVISGQESSMRDHAALFICGTVVMFIIVFLTQWLQYNKTYTVAYKESANRRIVLAEKLRKLPLSFFGQRDLSDLTTTIMGDCTALERVFSNAIPQLFGTIFMFIITAIGLLVLDWRMGLCIVVPVPVAALVVFAAKKAQSNAESANMDAKRAAYDGVQEYLDTIQELKSCSREEEYLEGLEKKLDYVVKCSFRNEIAPGAATTTAQFILRFGLVAVMLVGGILVTTGSLSIPMFILFLLFAGRIYDPFTSCFMLMAEVFSALVSVKRMKQIDATPEQTGTNVCNNKGYDIEFKNVVFSYNEEPVLKGVSFVAKQGEVTALVGPSGSGKSTASKLAARFWDADSGTITLGGVDVKTVEPETLFKNYAIVFQDVMLFDETVMENIRLGRGDATDEEVMAAARAAQCEEFIQRLPQGYQTNIGENGSALSGGERQRISIARALLKNAPIVLLDEATASMDAESETLIQDALSVLLKDKTVMVIAHRMRTVANADKIVVLDDGKVSEMGTPAELMKKGGLYAHLVELQQGK